MKTKEQKNKKMLHMRGIGQIKAFKNENDEGGKDTVFIEGLANRAVVDRGNEFISTDAWNLDNFKKNPVILFNHGVDPTFGGTPIGKAIDIQPTEEGLYIKAQLSDIDDPVMNRIRGLCKERILRAFSVGFYPTESEMDDKAGVRKITKAELFEVSIVGIPMNQDSLFELSGKMLKTKSFDELRRDILEKKGVMLAGAVNARIAKLVDDSSELDEPLDREYFAAEIAKEAEITEEEMSDILAGNVTPVPKEVITAIALVLDVDREELEKLDAQDLATLEEAAKAKDDQEEEQKKKDEEEQKAKDEEEQKKKDEEEAKQKEDEIQEQEQEEKKSKTQDFQRCVAEKIPVLITEGMDQDQAVAVAIQRCREAATEKGGPNIKPTVDDYKMWFKLADKLAAAKQAEQEDVSSTTTTISSASKQDQDNDFGSPYLDAQKQTNVLLGALINAVQQLSKVVEQVIVRDQPEEAKPVEAEAVAPVEESSEEPEKEKEETTDIDGVDSKDKDSVDSKEEKRLNEKLDTFVTRLNNVKQRLNILSTYLPQDEEL